MEREAQRNVEMMWLTGRLAPDFKTIADFRHDNGKGIRNACRRFVARCRQLNLFSRRRRSANIHRSNRAENYPASCGSGRGVAASTAEIVSIPPDVRH